MHKNMKKTVKPLILLFILNLFLFSCREDTFNEPTVLSETEMRFLNMNELKAGSLLSKEFFIEKIITDLEKQNRKKKFIPGFVQKYGYPDWDMTRWFVGNQEVVAQIPVFSDYGCETNAVIICIQHNNKLKFVLIVRDKFERFSKNEKPRPTIQKIEDLFIIFDFQRYGESNYLTNGKVVSTSGKNNGNLKSGWAEVETCYYMEVYSGGELLSSRFECEYSYYWVSTENYDENEYGGGGNYIDSEWYDNQSGGGNSSGNTDSSHDSNPTDNTMAIVDVTDLQRNEKASCIYGRLINENILPSFINRFFAPTNPIHSFLGELNLTWTIGTTTETIPIDSPVNNSYYSVEIRLSENMINSFSSTNIALTMLHEALHAKLIAEFYDETGTTDFKLLYYYYEGWGFGNIDQNQEMEMITTYAEQMAKALKDFDESQGIVHTLDFYIEALKYTFSEELGLNVYMAGQEQYSVLYYSTKTCQ